MESLLFLIDSLVIVVAAFFSLKNNLLKPGQRQIGPFAYYEAAPPKVRRNTGFQPGPEARR